MSGSGIPPGSPSFSCLRPGFASLLLRMVLQAPISQLMPSCWSWRERNQRSEMGPCICFFFCGSSAPALEISVLPPPVTSPFTFQPVTLEPFPLSLLCLQLCLCCFSALCPLPSMEGLDGLFRFGPWPGIPFLGAGSAHLCREPLLSYIPSHEKNPPPLPPFHSGNIHFTSQICLDEAAESWM